MHLRLLPLLLVGVALVLGGCQSVRPRTFVPRQGDEIVVAGQLFHTGTRVITWMDPGGYDAYRVERRFSPLAESSWEKSKDVAKDLGTPNRYGLRQAPLTPAEVERVRGGGWDLPTLQRIIDQFVIHYDVAGVSKACFKVLHDRSGLSVHFLLDLDGTIYQTLDLKERARHATIANDRSIGIEIANMGAYPPDNLTVLNEWYRRETPTLTTIIVPARIGDPLFQQRGFVGRPARPAPIRGFIQDQELVQYDLTLQQYAALIKLTAALCRVFPNLPCEAPREANGTVVPRKLSDEEWKAFRGVLGHYHLQANKIDPGPAFDWDKVLRGAQRLLRPWWQFWR